MPIPFACPHCGLETLVDDEYAGESGPCASCEQEITVPYLTVTEGSLAGAQVYARSPRTSAGYIFLLVIGGLGAAALAISVALLVIFPAFRTARTVAQGRSCGSNLRRIYLALQQYDEEHGTLPPAFIPDANGKPMHSWRVLILPFLDKQGLYDQYDFNQAWDSEANMPLSRYMPDVYACPSDPEAASLNETNYVVLTGRNTFFDDSKAKPLGVLGDDPASTILVVETPVTGMSWMEPRDLKAGRMEFAVNGGLGLEIGSYHDRGAHVLMADGTVQYLTDDTPSDYVEAMSTVRGGELVPTAILDD